MSPTILREKGYRFYFLSNEEERIHVHVECSSGEAKFWIEPVVSLASYCKVNKIKLNEIQKIVEKHKDEIIKEWKKFFSKH
ncbi:MAG: DUF4160 domain-containing protein [Candidatus Omnitrophica bacterium]|nr:DUF4160 domain-containing protein [Candidatus Omnitrophota bacterium]